MVQTSLIGNQFNIVLKFCGSQQQGVGVSIQPSRHLCRQAVEGGILSPRGIGDLWLGPFLLFCFPFYPKRELSTIPAVDHTLQPTQICSVFS